MCCAVVLFAATAFAGGFRLTEENDYFAGRLNDDKYYTQGLELDYVDDIELDRDLMAIRRIYGIRNLMYTPQDIEIPEPQPDDRPWAGLTAGIFQEWKNSRDGCYMWEYMVGVTGPWSQSDEIQTWMHKVIGSATPMGWSNQTPNEVVANVTYDRYKLLTKCGREDSWGADVTEVYGFSLGTAFVNGEYGWLGRAGWCVPSDYMGGSVLKPTLQQDDKTLSAYLFAQATGRAVLHNVLLGGSLFQDGPSQTLKPFVFDGKTGVALRFYRVFGSGYDFDLSYAFVCRSMEYYGQEEVETFGSVMLCVSREL